MTNTDGLQHTPSESVNKNGSSKEHPEQTRDEEQEGRKGRQHWRTDPRIHLLEVRNSWHSQRKRNESTRRNRSELRLLLMHISTGRWRWHLNQEASQTPSGIKWAAVRTTRTDEVSHVRTYSRGKLRKSTSIRFLCSPGGGFHQFSPSHFVWFISKS